MSEAEVRKLIRAAVARAPSLRDLAKQWGVSPSYLCDVCTRRRAPGPSVCKPLGIRRKVVVVYEKEGR